jgi:Zn-finger nucleic acid-binding protein
MGDSIYSVDCPKCSKTVWVNNGNTEDVTTPDVEAVICPWCEDKWLLDEFEDGGITTLENAFDQVGFKTPNEAAGM